LLSLLRVYLPSTTAKQARSLGLMMPHRLAVTLCWIGVLQQSVVAARLPNIKSVAEPRPLGGAPSAASASGEDQDEASRLQTQLGTKARSLASVTLPEVHDAKKLETLVPESSTSSVLWWLAVCTVCVSVALTILSRMGLVQWPSSGDKKWSAMSLASQRELEYRIQILGQGATVDKFSEAASSLMSWAQRVFQSLGNTTAEAQRVFQSRGNTTNDSWDEFFGTSEVPSDVNAECEVELRGVDVNPDEQDEFVEDDEIGSFLASKLRR